MSSKTWRAWGVQDKHDGRSYLIGSASVASGVNGLQGCTHSLMFATRKQCREYISERWGYIRTRKDLRSPPYNFRMPKVVRIEISARVIQ